MVSDKSYEESYHAQADDERADVLAATSPFTIDVRFAGGLTDAHKAAFAAAADRWTKVIVGDLPTVQIDGEVIDDVLIIAQGSTIDGPGRVLGQAGPTHLRPATAGPAASLTAKGIMSFDVADLAVIEAQGMLDDVIAHEMGHVLGIGTLWRNKGLLKGAATDNPTFSGQAAMAEYKVLRGGRSRRVPVENTGGPGTRNGHWREAVFQHELMSGFISAPGNALSRMTVASLADLGYQVDLDAAEPYELPKEAADDADEFLLVVHEAPVDLGVMIPVVPIVLPAASLDV